MEGEEQLNGMQAYVDNVPCDNPYFEQPLHKQFSNILLLLVAICFLQSFFRVPYEYSDTTQQLHATLTLSYAISILSCLFNMCVSWLLLVSEGGPNLAVTGE